VVGLGVLIGVSLGAVTASAAGARRTDTAYPRFLSEYRSADYGLWNLGFADATPEQLRKIPQVAEIEPFKWAMLKDEKLPHEKQFVAAQAVSRNRNGHALDRFKIIEGRPPNPDRVDEVVITLLGRDRGFRVGDTFELESFSPEEAPEFAALYKAIHSRPPIQMRVVGAVAIPGFFPPQVIEIAPLMMLTPEFYEQFPQGFPTPEGSYIRLRRGEADLPAFRTALAKATDVQLASFFSFFERRGQNANAQRSFHMQAVALWILAALGGGVVLLIATQLLARQTYLDADEHDRLQSLGMNRSQLWLVSMARAATTAIVGALLVAPVAVTLSPLTPTGLARIAEPRPGVAFDWAAISIGVTGCMVLILLLSAIPAWRVVRLRTRERTANSEPRSGVVEVLSRAGMGATLTTGIRLAVARGRGRNAVPVRSTLAGVGIGLAALVAAFTFGASLRHLNSEPRLYGVGWDLAIANDPSDFIDDGSGRKLLELPEVRGVWAGGGGNGLQIEGVPVTEVFAIDRIEGEPPLPLVSGRAPRSDAPQIEIALAPRTMRQVGARIGGIVQVRSDLFQGIINMRVVGETIVPVTSETSRSGEGAWISRKALINSGRVPEDSELHRSNYAFVDLAPGTDADRAFVRIGQLLGLAVNGDELYKPPFGKPSDISNFGRVERMPEILAGLLTLIAAGALAHALLTSVRRRRRDLAVLRTMGFLRRQVRAAVAVQATTLTAMAFAIGLPIGIILGRAAWRLVATDLGIIPAPIVPSATLAIAVPAGIVIANLVAALPGRAAARISPALVLRSE
jgi:ABC-type lipoprotein release transport system permease subunit